MSINTYINLHRNNLNLTKNLVIAFIFYLVIMAAGNCSAASLSGQMLMTDGTPMAGGMVGIFDKKAGPPPRPDLYVRIPDYVGDLDENGRFQVQVPEGNYYVGGFLDHPGKVGDGPPEKGDTLLMVKNKSGKLRLFTVTKKRAMNIGTVSSGTIFDPPDETAAIRGTITDANDNPVMGVTFIATDNKRNLGDSIKFISKPSSIDGAFQMGLPGQGVYRLTLWSSSRQEPIVSFSLTPKSPQLAIKNGHLVVTINKEQHIKRVSIKLNQ